MAQYTDLPEEINREILLKQSPSNIIHHCNVDKNTRKICNNINFWSDYMKEMTREEIETFVINTIRQSQDFIVLIHGATQKLIDENWRINDTIFFYCIMRGDIMAISHFSSLYVYETFFNYKKVVVTTNKIIDLVNSGRVNAEELGNLYLNLKDMLPGSYIRTLAILDQCNFGSISKLPAALFNEDDNSIAAQEYGMFILDIMSNLAMDGNTRDIINIVQKSYDNNAPLDTLYYVIAEYLPTELFSYVQSKLPKKVKLGKYIDIIRDRDHAYYLLFHPEWIQYWQMTFFPEFIPADEFATKIYKSCRIDKNNFIQSILSTNHARAKDEIKYLQWQREVDKKWRELKRD